jgi:hypothetical protein
VLSMKISESGSDRFRVALGMGIVSNEMKGRFRANDPPNDSLTD